MEETTASTWAGCVCVCAVSPRSEQAGTVEIVVGGRLPCPMAAAAAGDGGGTERIKSRGKKRDWCASCDKAQRLSQKQMNLPDPNENSQVSPRQSKAHPAPI